jgi:hypothetical protein
MPNSKPALREPVDQQSRASEPSRGGRTHSGNLVTPAKQSIPASAPARMDRAEIASMDSFPCSDPPGYNTSRS